MGTDKDFLRGKDMLEVACMRGGGARYLAEVAAPRTYIGTDSVKEQVDLCRRLHCGDAPERPALPGLRFEVADASRLPEVYPAESFDMVLCVQAASQFEDIAGFVRGSAEVLRPGGHLVIADAFTRNRLKLISDAIEEAGLALDVCEDISRAVHAVGLCSVSPGISYLR